jgi:hypothetical protein
MQPLNFARISALFLHGPDQNVNANGSLGNRDRYGVRGDKMADYYPLITKAVAGLAPDALSESRQALYDRMREALSTALRTAEPRFTEFQIMRERLALEDAVSRVEDEVAQLGRDVIPTDDDLPADTDDMGKAVDIPLMFLTGGAVGRMDPVWRFAWR